MVPPDEMRKLAELHLRDTGCDLFPKKDALNDTLAKSGITCGGRLRYAEEHLPSYVRAQMRSSQACDPLKQVAASILYFYAAKEVNTIEARLPQVKDCTESCGQKPGAKLS